MSWKTTKNHALLTYEIIKLHDNFTVHRSAIMQNHWNHWKQVFGFYNKSETALPDVLPKWSVDGPVLPLGVRPCPSVQSRSSVLDCVQPQSPLSKVHVAAVNQQDKKLLKTVELSQLSLRYRTKHLKCF